MTCKQPEQLNLYDELGDQFRAFEAAMNKMLESPWVVDEPESNRPCEYVKLATNAHGLATVAAWTKRMMVEMARDGRPELENLVRSFGYAFFGEEVGALGRDLLEFALRQDLATRVAAVEVLERWHVTDTVDVWMDIINEHIDRELDEELNCHCRSLVLEYLGDAEEEDVLEDPPELVEYLEVARSLPNRMRALVFRSQVPEFLERNVDVAASFVMGLFEGMSVGKIVARENESGVLMTRSAGGWQVRCWHPDGKYCFSLEPTATDDRVLLFVYF
jgi:hypothetical protein